MRAPAWGWALGLYVITAGCFPTEDDKPGELLGSFQAVGAKLSDSCGPVMVPEEQTLVTFELREDEGGVAYFQASGAGLLGGTLLDGTYRFPVTQTLQLIEPDALYGTPGCAVTRRDILTFTLEQLEAADGPRTASDDSGTAEDMEEAFDPTLTVLRGTHRIEFTPLSGAGCEPTLFAYGGPYFSALPCEYEYTLSGSGIE